MAVIQSNTNSEIAEVGAAVAKGLHVIVKPQDAGPYGHYRLATATGAIAAGAGADSEVFQFWWTETIRYALIQRVWLTGMRATTAFAAGAIDIKLTRATGWTAAGTGGGTVTVASPELELRPPTMGVSGVAEIRVATTAALGAGTKTLDTYNLGWIATHSSGGVGAATPIIGSIFLPTLRLFDSPEHPLVLSENEGFVVRATVPATGVWNLGLAVSWCEVEEF
jgi:hypothetical protein